MICVLTNIINIITTFYIRRKGLEKVTVEELVSEITPHGRSTGMYFSAILMNN